MYNFFSPSGLHATRMDQTATKKNSTKYKIERSRMIIYVSFSYSISIIRLIFDSGKYVLISNQELVSVVNKKSVKETNPILNPQSLALSNQLPMGCYRELRFLDLF